MNRETRYHDRVAGRYIEQLVRRRKKGDGVSQNELAASCGHGKYELAKWISGVSHPRPPTRAALMKQLDGGLAEFDAAILADKMAFFLASEGADLDGAAKALRKLRRAR